MSASALRRAGLVHETTIHFQLSAAHFVLAPRRRPGGWRESILALAGTLALAAEPPRNVLVLYSDNRLLPGLAVIDETLDQCAAGRIRTRGRAVQRDFLIWTDHVQRVMRMISLRSCARSTRGTQD